MLYKTWQYVVEKHHSLRFRKKYGRNEVKTLIDLYNDPSLNPHAPSIDDRVSFYFQLSHRFWELFIENRYDGKTDECFNNTYLAAASYLEGYRFYELGEMVTNCAIVRNIDTDRYVPNAIYYLLAVNEWEAAEEFARKYCKLFYCLIANDNTGAVQELEEIRDPTEDELFRDVYYTEPLFLKGIIRAIIDSDQKEFETELAKRIKRYRKNWWDYSTVIDFCSVALIKIAVRRGLKYPYHIIEIPEFFLDTTKRVDKSVCKLPVVKPKQEGLPE